MNDNKYTQSLNVAKIHPQKVSFFVISLLLIVVFCVLSVLFPYTGDDWAWGSSVGTERLANFFDNYNGRYLGNFTILLLSRSVVAKVISMTAIYYITCWLCYAYTPYKKNAVLIFAIFLFFSMNRSIWAQTVAWASGFANYVPSAVISMVYILLIRNITGEQTPRYPKYLSLITFIMGFAGAPFIENIALFNVCLGIAVIGYTAIKFKKAYTSHWAFLAGAICGAVWMFSNSVYTSINNGDDGYRTVPSGRHALKTRLFTNGYEICDYAVLSNYLICTVVCVLLVLTAIKFIKTAESKPMIAGAGAAVAINVSCTVLILYNYFRGLSVSDNLLILLTCTFAVSIVAVVLICIPKGMRFRMLLPVYCIPVTLAPLLVVTPIGPRCFYISYLLMMVFAADLFGYVLEGIQIKSANYKRIFCAVSAAAILQIGFYISVFVPIYQYDVKRNEFAKVQSDNKEEIIVVAELPNKEFLWTSTPLKEPKEMRYKLFHGLRQEAKIEIMKPAAFDEYYENYNRK